MCPATSPSRYLLWPLLLCSLVTLFPGDLAAQSPALDLNRQSILFLTGIDAPGPDPQPIIRDCQRMGFGGVLFEFPVWLGVWPSPPPYDVPHARWPGGVSEAAEYFRAYQRAGIRIGAQMPLHQPPGGYSRINEHVAGIAELCKRLGLTQVVYFDGAEHIGHPLHIRVDYVIDMFLEHMTSRPLVIQSSVGALCRRETRGGQTDYHWHSADRMKEAHRAIANSAEYARQHSVAADGGWLTDTVPGGDGTIRPLSLIEIDTIWAWALGHNAALTFRTSQAGLRAGNYSDSACWSMWLLEYVRRIDGGSQRWAYLREPLQADQWGWMYCPLANPPIIAAYEAPYPARCNPHLHMYGGELPGARVVMVWSDAPLTIEFNVAHSHPGAHILRVANYRGQAVPFTTTTTGHTRLPVGRDRLYVVTDDTLTRYELNIALRFATAQPRTEP